MCVCIVWIKIKILSEKKCLNVLKASNTVPDAEVGLKKKCWCRAEWKVGFSVWVVGLGLELRALPLQECSIT